MQAEGSRPAFYALQPGGWRDYVTLLHPPYTAWHLSYVAIGAALILLLLFRPDGILPERPPVFAPRPDRKGAEA